MCNFLKQFLILINILKPDNELLVLGSSQSLSGMAASNMMASSLQPGEIVKNSGKFVKPTKIPGKNYSKDEIIIRNSDSGKGKSK